MKDADIEEHLKNVRLIPTFELPKDLKTAAKYLNIGKYSSGFKQLEKYLKKPKDEEVAQAARDAIEKVNAYGKSRMELVDSYVEEGYYADAMEILADVDKKFKGIEIGDQAKAKISEWRKDKTIKLELQGSMILNKANDLTRDKKYKSSASLLLQIIKSKKFEGTKARDRAEKEFHKIESYL